MNHFFVRPENITPGENGEGGSAFLSGNDVNHIQNVLRMKTGEELLLSDGLGNDYHCAIETFEDGCVKVKILDRTASLTEPSLKVTLFQALTKADKFEWIVQKAVELGASEIVPVETARCVVKYDRKKQESKKERWQKIAEGAAKQSRRGIIPEVKPVMRFEEALSYAEKLDGILIPYENYKDIKATKETLAALKPDMRIGIFIGPEGGFAEQEVEAAAACGAQQISLGNRILRTETAPLMILSVLMFQME